MLLELFKSIKGIRDMSHLVYNALFDSIIFIKDLDADYEITE